MKGNNFGNSFQKRTIIDFFKVETNRKRQRVEEEEEEETFTQVNSPSTQNFSSSPKSPNPSRNISPTSQAKSPLLKFVSPHQLNNNNHNQNSNVNEQITTHTSKSPISSAFLTKSSSSQLENDLLEGITPDMLLDEDYVPETLQSKQKVQNTPQVKEDISSNFMKKYENLLTTEEKKKKKAIEFKKSNEERFSWLEDIRDMNQKRPGEPGYDPSTLYIPPSSLQKFTEFESQYWEIKRFHWDTIIFFKKGKFYELYEKDAEIAKEKLDLKLTDRVNMKMAGVPESHFIPWANKLIKLGYKIGRVDQVETLQSKNLRTNQDSSKVLKRELTKIYTIGTLVEEGLLNSAYASYLLCIYEDKKASTYGICYVDTATGEFNLGFIEDDKQFHQLETLILRISPKEFVYNEHALSSNVLKLLKSSLPGCILTPRRSKNLWTAELTIQTLINEKYFGEESSIDSFPSTIKQFIDTVTVISTLGIIVEYLKELKLDRELISMKNFRHYNSSEQNRLLMDGQTLHNLEIIENSDHGLEGTLLKYMDHCLTASGKRLLKKWICYPLVNLSEINDRLDSIEDLKNLSSEVLEEIRHLMASLPDLERLISRIHAGTSKLIDFLNVLDSYDKIQEFMSNFQVYIQSFKSIRLKKLLSFQGLFPNLKTYLQDISNKFDREASRETGSIIPKKGAQKDFDAIQARLDKYETELENILEKYQKYFGDRSIQYKHIGKSTYQLEISQDSLKKRSLPKEFIPTSQTKSAQRYWTAEITELVKNLEIEKEKKDEVARTLLQRQFDFFDLNYQNWLRCIQCLAELDVLLSLSKVSFNGGKNSRPQFLTDSEPYLEIFDMRHPCITPKIGTDFIENDIAMGKGSPHVLLLSGPNMGGKSTLLRQVCIITIMAQLGCYVPASRCILTPVDQIFTRIGASDDILGGRSTFMVELQETSNILKYATSNSLVILDELGRGTSTFDGYSIAYSVLHHLTHQIKCRTLFSTHYHQLCDEFCTDPKVRLGHMACLVDEENRDVTFLYKLIDGSSEKSYGTHCALIAGIPKCIVENAEVIAQKFETTFKQKNSTFKLDEKFVQICSVNNLEDQDKLILLWQQLKY